MKYFDGLTKEYNIGGLLKHGESIYYVGTALFVAGIISLVLGAISIIFFQIHYKSESYVLFNTTLLIGMGLILVSLGINLMMKQKKTGQYIFSLGTIFSSVAIVLFLLNFEHNLYYPTISYILLLYICGFVMLLGNAFGHITLYLIHSAQGSRSKQQALLHLEYTDEEIQKDIDEAVQKSIEHSAEELQFDYVDTRKLKIGQMDSESESVVRVKDDMNETTVLKQTIDPGDIEEWGNMGVEKASLQLAETLNQKTSQKPGYFQRLKNFIMQDKNS